MKQAGTTLRMRRGTNSNVDNTDSDPRGHLVGCEEGWVANSEEVLADHWAGHSFAKPASITCHCRHRLVWPSPCSRVYGEQHSVSSPFPPALASPVCSRPSLYVPHHHHLLPLTLIISSLQLRLYTHNMVATLALASSAGSI